jgi:signal transduction histidine kinase
VACYIQLIGIAERKGYESTLGMGYVNLGILYQDYNELDKAYPYLTQSIPINEKYRPDLVALAHMNVGLINYEKGILDSALFYFRKALGMYVSLKEKNSIADVYNNIGNAYYDAHNLDSAYYYFKQAKDLYKQLSYWYTYAQVNNNMALVFMDREIYDKALQLLDTSLYYAEKTHNTELLSVIYKNKYTIYNSQHDYRRALENYLLHDSLQDLIYSLDKEKVIADLEMRYQDEKKQAQILALEKINLQKDLALEKRTRQKNIFLFTGLAIILLIAFAFLYFTLRAKKDRIIAQQRIRQLEEEKKLLAARSLVEGQEEERKRIARELHDGLGVLLSTTKMQFSAIRDKLPENQALIERAVKLLEQASSDVRKISHNMMPGLLTKLGLFEAVADLFEKVSETESITVRADIPEDAERLPENQEIMIYRIIQELVNNTLKHAQARTIEIQMQVLPGRLDIIYTDDGKGFNMEEKAGSKSIGLQSIQSRVNFLNGTMQLYSEPGKGVSYKLDIPN